MCHCEYTMWHEIYISSKIRVSKSLIGFYLSVIGNGKFGQQIKQVELPPEAEDVFVHWCGISRGQSSCSCGTN